MVTTLALVVWKAQSQSMINDTASPTTRTDIERETNKGNGQHVAKGLRARSPITKLLAATAVAVGVLASTAAPASADHFMRDGLRLAAPSASAGSTGGIPLAKPIVGVVQVEVVPVSAISVQIDGTTSVPVPIPIYEVG